ncbi:hypothetical protein [Nakamurella lactea]|uniref:hypothetical protein n=1 Tax=Nakamurella lactea TaxID=459515 RepID=UPI0012B59C4E|nr:hypothetical protein [Nakamurella lactea]
MRASVRPVAAAPYAEPLPNPVAELLSARGSAVKAQTSRLLAGGLSAAEGGRLVAVGSLSGGTGASTVAALLWQAWSARGVPGVLLDAAGGWRPGLADRIDPAELIARAQWSDFLGRGDQQLTKEFDAVRAAAGARSVLVVRDGRPSGQLLPPQRPLHSDVREVGRAASRSWPLVIHGLGHGTDSQAGELVGQLSPGDEIGDDPPGNAARRRSSAPDLVVVVCRFSAVELRDVAEVLRLGHRIDPRQRVVIAACGQASEWTPAVAAAVAATTDAAAGVVRIDHVRGLRDRTAYVHRRHVGHGITRLAAGIAATPTTQRGTR